jgi:hypothetical protein
MITWHSKQHHSQGIFERGKKIAVSWFFLYLSKAGPAAVKRRILADRFIGSIQTNLMPLLKLPV